MANRIEKVKRDRLKDLLRRAMANPDKLDEVVDAVLQDWFPLVTVSPKGVIAIDVRRVDGE